MATQGQQGYLLRSRVIPDPSEESSTSSQIPDRRDTTRSSVTSATFSVGGVNVESPPLEARSPLYVMSRPTHQTKDLRRPRVLPANIELIVQKAVKTAMAVFHTEFLQMIRDKFSAVEDRMTATEDSTSQLAIPAAGDINADLSGRVDNIEKQLGELSYAQLRKDFGLLAETVIKPQKFLEALDAKERRNNVIITTPVMITLLRLSFVWGRLCLWSHKWRRKNCAFIHFHGLSSTHRWIWIQTAGEGAWWS